MLLEVLVLVVLLLGFFDYLWKREINAKMPDLAGPLNLPIIGSMWMYFRRKPDELLAMSQELRRLYGRTVQMWILHVPGFFTSDLSIIQEVLSHPTEIKKNRMYWLLTAWLGDGLLVSNGRKWLGRRRVITPTFHFAILEQFVRIFDRQAEIMCAKLEQHAAVADADADAGADKWVAPSPIDVHNYVALATLDVICETAMGVRINAQTESQCEYVRLLLEMSEIILKRFVNMTYRSDFIFALIAPKLAKRHNKVKNALHAFTERIIEERRNEMLLGKNQQQATDTASNDLGIKPRQALLDVLLSSTIDGQPLSNADIREEVDTFMFEGHDTTKSGIGFTLYCISREPEVQRKLYAEILEVLGHHSDGTELSQRALMELKYTEKVIKEALRMYPPVPFIGRQIMQDCYVNGNICLPKGVSVLMALISMQNDPEYFPEPERFLPERTAHENAFAFVPFSAGPRNCVGQRFAMLEMKAFVTRIVQRYELLPLGAAVVPTVSLVLDSKTGWQMGFRRRVGSRNLKNPAI